MKIILLVIFSAILYTINTQELLNCNVISSNLYGIQDFTANDSTIFFTACSLGNNECEMYSTIGTSDSIIKIDILPGSASSYPNSLVNFQNNIFFTAKNSTGQRAIYKANSTSSVYVVDNPVFSPYSTSDLSVVNNRLYFDAIDEKDYPRAYVKLNTDPGFSNFAQYSTPTNKYYQCQNNVIFNADNGLGIFVQVSQGLPGSRSFIQTNFTFGQEFTPFKNRVYFVSYVEGHGTELAYSDCSLSKTSTKLMDLNPGASGSSPSYLTVFGDYLYLTIRNGSTNNMYKIDSSDNVFKVTNFFYLTNLYAFGSRIYFSVLNSTTNTYDLYNADSQDNIKLVLQNMTSKPNFVTFGNTMYFVNKEASVGYEIFGISSSAPETVFLAVDLFPGTNSSHPSNFFVNQNNIYFEAQYPPNSFYSCTKASNTVAPTFVPSTVAPFTILPTSEPTQTSLPTVEPTSQTNTTSDFTVNISGQAKKKVEWPTWSIVMSAVSGSFIILSIIVLVTLNMKF